MHYPGYRPRRLRRNEDLRRLTREARLPVDSFVNPVLLSRQRREQNRYS